jgi:hypothetical protein
MATYGPFPRDTEGKIILDPLFDERPLRDDLSVAEATPAPMPAEGAPPPAPPPVPSPARMRGDTPTPIGQLRPGQPVSPAPEDWRMWLSGVALLMLLLTALAALWPRAAAPLPATAAAPTVAALTPTVLLARALVAFDVPHGTPVGALEAGRSYALLDERDGWRQLVVPGSGTLWVRAWEMDGAAPPTPMPTATLAPSPAPVVRPAPVAQPVIVPVGPPVTCLPVTDADNGGRYLGDACGATTEARQATALALLQSAPPPTGRAQP